MIDQISLHLVNMWQGYRCVGAKTLYLDFAKMFYFCMNGAPTINAVHVSCFVCTSGQFLSKVLYILFKTISNSRVTYVGAIFIRDTMFLHKSNYMYMYKYKYE